MGAACDFDLLIWHLQLRRYGPCQLSATEAAVAEAATDALLEGTLGTRATVEDDDVENFFDPMMLSSRLLRHPPFREFFAATTRDVSSRAGAALLPLGATAPLWPLPS